MFQVRREARQLEYHGVGLRRPSTDWEKKDTPISSDQKSETRTLMLLQKKRKPKHFYSISSVLGEKELRFLQRRIVRQR